MGLIGNPFENFVKSQVNVRQKALGEGFGKESIKLDTQKVFNTSSPWIRLSSGVRINDNDTPGNTYKQLKNLSYLQINEWDGDALSKNLVLAGGATNDKGNFIAGIEGSSVLTKSYGFGGNQINGRGFVPMPGIISCDFEYKNDGALAFAKVQIKAFSKEQFQLLDILYQRPGYTCLLEFGHSVFLGNDGKVKYAGKGDYSFNTKPFQKIFSSPGTDNNFFNMAQDIESERKKWSGNYEGFFGRITKFKWKFNPDGTYDMEVNLVGTGDVISSLQVNVPRVIEKPFTFVFGGGKVEKPSEKDKEEAEEEGATVIADAMASQLNFELYALFYDKSKPKGVASDLTIKKFPYFDESSKKTVEKNLVIKKGIFKANVAGITKDYDPNTWIKFSVLLAMLQKICNVKDTKGKNYLLNFDLNWKDLKKDTTFMATHPGNFSADPNKILAEYTTPPAFSGYTLVTNTTLNNAIKTGNFNNKELGTEINPQFYRRLGDIYVNINFIADQLKGLKGTDKDADDLTEIKLLDFLKAILEAINTQMGGINNFRVMFNDKTNKISIISQTPLISKQEPEVPTIINTFGIESNQGSFVKSIDLDSELTDAMANQITMAAQSEQSDSKGNGVDGTSFASYNGGLKDRLFVKKKTTMDEAIDKGEAEGVEEENYYKQVWDDNTKEAFRENIVSGLSKHVIADLTSKKVAKTQATFFLPFNLGITMHGLSGIKIFQSFQSTGRELPLSYNPALISLIVKSYSHNVSGEGWTTKISTFAKPLKKVDSSALKVAKADEATPPKSASGSNGPVQQGEGGNTIPSSYPVGKIYYTNPTNKIQIYLHHTAGWQNIKQVIAGWNKRTDHVATHFVTNNNGEAERLFKDEEHANHLGIKSGTFAKVGAKYQNLNRVSLGIEMCSIGPLKLKGDKYYCYPNSFNTLYDPTKKTTSKNGDVQRIINYNLNPSSYKGYEYCEGFSDAHLAQVYNIVTKWKSKYGIPYTYNWFDLFPAKGKLSANALKGVKGIYTHNSVKTSKMDVMPTLKTINLFKSLAD
jgi:hypothetical protein